MSDSTALRAQLMATLKTIAEETKPALVGLLGQPAYDAYVQNGGSWVPSATGTGFVVSTSDGNGAVRVMKMDSITTSGTGGSAERLCPTCCLLQVEPLLSARKRLVASRR